MRNYLKSMIAPLVAALLTAAFVVPVANGAFWQWSKTSASNGSADPSINFQEGMSPSAVNDSARALMARAAEYRDDISGLLATGGSAAAYTVTTNQGLNSVPNDGQLLAITVHATNSAGATLTADGGTTYPIQSASGTAVSAGILISSSPYTLKFSTSASAWILRDFYGSPFGIPIGSLTATFSATAPNSNFILPAGQCISRTTYATFFVMVGTRFGVCDGTTTFAAPDLRGKVLAAIDNLGGTSANILTSTYFGSDPTIVGASSGTLDHFSVAVTNLPASPPVGTFVGTTQTWNLNQSGILQNSGVHMQSGASAFGGNDIGVPTVTVTPAGTLSMSNLGSGTPITSVQPTMTVTYALRVL